MTIKYFPDKNYSWLALPVFIDGLHRNYHPHVTLKFFGQALLDADVIERKMQPFPYDALEKFEFQWRPEVWPSLDHTDFHSVLLLEKYPSSLTLFHDVFSVIRDQHKPWKPHISVPVTFQTRVATEGLSPKDCNLKFGEIELCLGGPNL